MDIILFKIFQHVDETFPLLLKTLSDPSDEVGYINELLLIQIIHIGQFLAYLFSRLLILYKHCKHLILCSLLLILH